VVVMVCTVLEAKVDITFLNIACVIVINSRKTKFNLDLQYLFETLFHMAYILRHEGTFDNIGCYFYTWPISAGPAVD